LNATIHRIAHDRDDGDADEHDVEHEELPTPDHQVADTFTRSEQLDDE